jgi:hypothetical protein
VNLRTPAELQARYPWLKYSCGEYRVVTTVTAVTTSDRTRARRERIVKELNALRDATRKGAAT